MITIYTRRVLLPESKASADSNNGIWYPVHISLVMAVILRGKKKFIIHYFYTYTMQQTTTAAAIVHLTALMAGWYLLPQAKETHAQENTIQMFILHTDKHVGVIH